MANRTACPRRQCRGRIPHSWLTHWTPCWLLDLKAWLFPKRWTQAELDEIRAKAKADLDEILKYCD